MEKSMKNDAKNMREFGQKNFQEKRVFENFRDIDKNIRYEFFLSFLYF